MKKTLLLILTAFLLFGFGMIQTASASTLELALVLDGSGSISDSDFQKQLDGYKNAFASGSFYDTFVTPSKYDTLVVSAFQFATNVIREIDWTTITNNTQATDFGNLFTTSTFTQLGQYTNTDAAIQDATAYFGSSTNDRVIDISTDGDPTRSGDGSNTSSGDPVHETNAITAADNARAAGITVNAIGIGSNINADFLEDLVGIGSGSGNTGFYLSAANFNDFSDVLEDKLGREIIGTTIPEPGTMILFGFGLLGMANISRRRK